MDNRIKELRQNHALSQSRIADILGLSESSYGMYDRGQRFPSYETLVAMANYYDVSLDYLLSRTDFPSFFGSFSKNRQIVIRELVDASDDAIRIVAEILSLDARSKD